MQLPFYIMLLFYILYIIQSTLHPSNQLTLYFPIYQIIAHVQKIQDFRFAYGSVQQHGDPVLFIHMISR